MQEVNFKKNIMIYKATNSKMKGAPKHGAKPLNFFTLFETKIGWSDEDGQAVNQSLVAFRFHSNKAFAQKTYKKHKELHGGIHVRAFIYNGVDKTEAELVDWSLNTDQVANDGVTTIFGAIEIN